MNDFFTDGTSLAETEEKLPDEPFGTDAPGGAAVKAPCKKRKLDKAIFAVLLIALLLSTAWLSVRMFVLDRYQVNQFSMTPTINDGQLIWANKLKKPQRYDVVSIESEKYYKKANIVPEAKKSDGSPKYDPLLKRIVGVAGDVLSVYEDGDGNKWVRITHENGGETILINEDYGGGKLDSLWYWAKPEDWSKTVTVPEGCVFVLGDMRGRRDGRDSVDSRMFGPVDREDIIAVVCGYNKNLLG